ncbi:SPFH/Band 7/PHB domain protein [Striga asiatica]|uniref:SPFH/Band 7/PHB domain protein n=1 Tax=Striga asiatica TaxID=4170 RepID=A0A5A7PG23_STRAF|nr:SPFH/Band 7/PHB domain protein [Striga asiatica]
MRRENRRVVTSRVLVAPRGARRGLGLVDSEDRSRGRGYYCEHAIPSSAHTKKNAYTREVADAHAGSRVRKSSGEVALARSPALLRGREVDASIRREAKHDRLQPISSTQSSSIPHVQPAAAPTTTIQEQEEEQGRPR